ncbi:MAG: CinA family protein [Xanthomonadales bacterium]|nr:CinA family protein [Gammaproteobacteria bacterium]MBT8051484.1 CinA family protein [Gammaproteobacteria bacterium]MBT8055642.1 CinA family protein [Gammaproteobacteria bacterium]NNJ79575.1 CinA family protein [Xanthomonadales bacterium]NNL05458.1 CinA family protein [Xanthomonadales bacterium]
MTRADDRVLEGLAKQLAEALIASGRRLATAESCTGGWIAKCCTDIAGSSSWFERGFVCYSYASKREVLGVDAVELESQGAVSEVVARQMARGAVGHSRADLALAVTGIAGPGGGMPDKPVGTVWFAWALEDRVDSEICTFAGGREAVRRQTVAHALRGMIERL